jgi:hypothetical protein
LCWLFRNAVVWGLKAYAEANALRPRGSAGMFDLACSGLRCFLLECQQMSNGWGFGFVRSTRTLELISRNQSLFSVPERKTRTDLHQAD